MGSTLNFPTPCHRTATEATLKAKTSTVTASTSAASLRGKPVGSKPGIRAKALLRTNLLAVLFWQLPVHSQDFGRVKDRAVSPAVFFLGQQVILFSGAADPRQLVAAVMPDVLSATVAEDLRWAPFNLGGAFAAQSITAENPEKVVKSGSDAESINLARAVQNARKARTRLRLHFPAGVQRLPASGEMVIAAEYTNAAETGTRQGLGKDDFSADIVTRATTSAIANSAAAQKVPAVTMMGGNPLRATSPTNQATVAAQEAPCGTSLACLLSERTVRKYRIRKSLHARQRTLAVFTTCAIISAIASVLGTKLAVKLYNRHREVTREGGLLQSFIENHVLSVLARNHPVRMLVFTVIAGILGHDLLRRLTKLLILSAVLGAFTGVLTLWGSQVLVHTLIAR